MVSSFCASCTAGILVFCTIYATDAKINPDASQVYCFHVLPAIVCSDISKRDFNGMFRRFWGLQVWRKAFNPPQSTEDEVPGFLEYTTSKYYSALVRLLYHILSLLVIASISLLPALAILVLNSIDTTNKSIYVTIGLTGGLAVLLRVITNANLKDVFAATLAYARSIARSACAPH